MAIGNGSVPITRRLRELPVHRRVHAVRPRISNPAWSLASSSDDLCPKTRYAAEADRPRPAACACPTSSPSIGCAGYRHSCLCVQECTLRREALRSGQRMDRYGLHPRGMVLVTGHHAGFHHVAGNDRTAMKESRISIVEFHSQQAGPLRSPPKSGWAYSCLVAEHGHLPDHGPWFIDDNQRLTALCPRTSADGRPYADCDKYRYRRVTRACRRRRSRPTDSPSHTRRRTRCLFCAQTFATYRHALARRQLTGTLACHDRTRIHDHQ